ALTLPRPLRPPPFPYTTLFRSTRCTQRVIGQHPDDVRQVVQCGRADSHRFAIRISDALVQPIATSVKLSTRRWPFVASPWRGCRSEEHTSELQSRENLVCRLLL